MIKKVVAWDVCCSYCGKSDQHGAVVPLDRMKYGTQKDAISDHKQLMLEKCIIWCGWGRYKGKLCCGKCYKKLKEEEK